MKFKLHLSLLITMLLVGLVFGSLYHYLIMPLLHGELVHCIAVGMIFGLINYFIGIVIYKRFKELEKINKALKKNINVDKLTTLFNRRAFDNDMLEMSESDTYSLIFIDIDNFSQFNNEFGHMAGDIVIQKVSQAIKNHIRSSDRAYRYGGEEFIILLKDCDKNNAFSIAEKIRMNISEIDNSPFPSITVSSGVANYPDDGADPWEIISASDKALLTSKKSGKNRTCIYNAVQDTIYLISK